MIFQQEVDRRVAKCIRCNLQFVNTLKIQFLMLTLTDLSPNVHVILKLLLTLSVGSCIYMYVTGLSRLFVASGLGVEQQ